MMKRVSYILFLKLLFFHIASFSFIENGKMADQELIEKTNFVALLMKDNQGKVMSYCTGTQVSENLILIARHCLLNSAVSPIGISIDLSPEKSEIHEIDSFAFVEPNAYIVREKADNNIKYQTTDMAVIKLKQPIPRKCYFV